MSAGNQVKTVETHTITIYFWIKKESKIYREKINEPTVSYAIYTEVLYKNPPTLLEGILSECVDNI